MHTLAPLNTINTLKQKLTNRKGQSLAEFAVITAMMATFVMTAIPKFSDVMESGKANKSIDEIDKILLQAKNFYETTAALEGRGRLPGQDKFDMEVGGYMDTTELFTDLETFTTYTDPLGLKWVSVFGSWVYEFLISMNTVINFVRRIFGVKNYWSFSAYIKYKVKNAVNFISKYETTLVNVCKKNSYDGVICGHIHHAAIEDYEGITYHNCGDWVESCTALVEDHDGNISLIDYSKENLTINLRRIQTAEKAA